MSRKVQYLLMVHAYQEKVVEDVVIALTELGVRDVFSCTGVNESRRLSHNVPIFAGFKGEMGKSTSLCKILSAVIPDPGMAESLLKTLKLADIDLVGDDLGSVAVIPLYSYWHYQRQ